MLSHQQAHSEPLECTGIATARGRGRSNHGGTRSKHRTDSRARFGQRDGLVNPALARSQDAVSRQTPPTRRPHRRGSREAERGEVVNVYANVYAHGWGPNGEKLPMFMLMRMLMRMLMVVVYPGVRCACLYHTRQSK